MVNGGSLKFGGIGGSEDEKEFWGRKKKMIRNNNALRAGRLMARSVP